MAPECMNYIVECSLIHTNTKLVKLYIESQNARPASRICDQTSTDT